MPLLSPLVIPLSSYRLALAYHGAAYTPEKNIEMLTVMCAAFADCARGRTFSVAWACRNLHMAMNNCMKAHATPEEQDAAREEWFATRLQRLKERERKAKRAAEQEAFFREWWGLPQKEREEIEKKLEKFKHVEERVAVVRKKTPGEERR